MKGERDYGKKRFRTYKGSMSGKEAGFEHLSGVRFQDEGTRASFY